MAKKVVFIFITLLFSIVLISCTSQSTGNTNEKEKTKSETMSSNQSISDNKKVTQAENTTESSGDKNSDIKIDGIYKMHIIGKTPSAIGLKDNDTNYVSAKIGVISYSQAQKLFYITGREHYDIDFVSGFGIKGDTSIFDKRIFQNLTPPIFPDKIDVNRLVLVYFKRPSFQEAYQVVAYSKIVDMKHRMNNIQNVRFDGKVESSDILLDVVAVVKENENYKLISDTMYYNVMGELPKEMSDALIKRPEGEYPTVDINKLFVVYMTSFTVNKSDDGKEAYSVKVLTYSPLSGGEPVNMDEQRL